MAYALLACDVFLEELKELAGPTPPWQAEAYLEMGLHDQPDNLRTLLQAKIEEWENELEVDTIVLAYGRCGNGLVGLRGTRCQLVLPQAHDCVSILLGSKERHEAILKNNPGTYFYTPGWVRGKRVPGPGREAFLRELYAERFDDDEEMIEELVEADRESYEHHNCAAYVSIIDRPEAHQYCQGCARHLNWQQEDHPGDPSFLLDLIQGNWKPERFLIVPPGQAIGANADGLLIAVPSDEQ